MNESKEIVISSMQELYDLLMDEIKTQKQISRDKIELEVYNLEKKIKRLESLVFVSTCTLVGLYVGVWIMILKG